MFRLVYICDWLPPDFGAVGQYSLHFARERARAGEHVVLLGLSSKCDSVEKSNIGSGLLEIIRIRGRNYDKSNFAKRLLWTIQTNCRLLWQVRHRIRKADEVLFTGSPPFLLHLLAPLNIFLRRNLVYRITDFHPECLMASLDRIPLWLQVFYRLTVTWRRTVNQFEVLGEDQRERLRQIGIANSRISLKRDLSPVEITEELEPLPTPVELSGYSILLYSGNFGVAHDHETFLEGYRLHHTQGSGRVGLWLNATGAKADLVERAIREARLPIYRSRPVPLQELPRLLVTPDAHLITLRDPFVGFVLPSKVYGCIESGWDILYVGSERSDIHLLCSQGMRWGSYYHHNVGDAAGVAAALEAIADGSNDVRNRTHESEPTKANPRKRTHESEFSRDRILSATRTRNCV